MSKRTLAAVLFSDIRGYSRQMQEDEDGTLRRLKAHNAIFERCAAEHDGRVVKTVGDSFMIAFASAVDAVRCGLSAQEALRRWSDEHPGETELAVRIGVHAGEVVEDEGDLFGETVNLAARLEPLAPVGTVAVSPAVLTAVRGKVSARARSLGEQTLKNIAEPVVVTALEPADERLAVETVHATGPPPPRRRWLWAVAGLGLVAAVVALMLRQASPPPEAPASAAPPPGDEAGATLRLAMTEALGDAQLYGHTATMGRTIVRLVHDPLIRITEDGEIQPAAVKRWASEDGGRVLRLALRDDLWFSRHACLAGTPRPATAEDLAYSLTTAIDAGVVALPLGDEPVRVTGREVTLHLAKPAPLAIGVLEEVLLIPAGLGDCERFDKMRQPVGTGPFRLDGALNGEPVKLLRHAKHWERDRDGRRVPRVEQLELTSFTEVATALSRLAAGELEAVSVGDSRLEKVVETTEVGHVRLAPAFARYGDVQVAADFRRTVSTLAGVLLVMRDGRPLADAEVRTAIAMRLSRDALVASFPMPLQPTSRLLEPRMLGYAAQAPAPPEDREGSVERLRRAGFRPAAPLELRIGHTSARDEPIAKALASQLSGSLVKAVVLRLSEHEFNHMFDEDVVDMVPATVTSRARGDEPLGLLSLLRNVREAGLVAPELEELADAIAGAADRDARRKGYAELEQRLLALQPFLPLGFTPPERPARVLLLSTRVGGLADPVSGHLRVDAGSPWRLAELKSGPPHERDRE